MPARSGVLTFYHTYALPSFTIPMQARSGMMIFAAALLSTTSGYSVVRKIKPNKIKWNISIYPVARKIKWNISIYP